MADPRTSPCALCGGPTEAAFTASDRNRGLGAERFHYARCTACGTLALSNPPSDLGRFYPASYYDLPSAENLPPETDKVDLLKRFVQPGRLVEIGPGSGAFAHTARQAGFDVTGSRWTRAPPSTCAARRRERDQLRRSRAGPAGPPAVTGDRPLAGDRARPDPGEVLDAAAANLEPGGALILATPNPDRSSSSSWARAGRTSTRRATSSCCRSTRSPQERNVPACGASSPVPMTQTRATGTASAGNGGSVAIPASTPPARRRAVHPRLHPRREPARTTRHARRLLYRRLHQGAA